MTKTYSSFHALQRFFKYAKPWKGKILLSTLYSILNKLFDIAPEILIGIAVDLVVKKQDSIIAKMGFESIQSQIIALAVATFLIWFFECYLVFTNNTLFFPFIQDRFKCAILHTLANLIIFQSL